MEHTGDLRRISGGGGGGGGGVGGWAGRGRARPTLLWEKVGARLQG